MTRYQKGQLRKIFKTDCKLRGRYIDGRATCAIGALIVASTKSGDELREEMKLNNRMPISSLNKMAEHIRLHFGLSQQQQSEIQDANDGVRGSKPKHVRRRRAAVLKVIDSFITK